MNRVYLLTIAIFTDMVLLAQERATTEHTEVTKKTGDSFWGQPWVWALGGAIFILLLVALARGGNRK